MTHSIIIDRRENEDTFFQSTDSDERVAGDTNSESLAFTLLFTLKSLQMSNTSITVIDQGDTIFTAAYDEEGGIVSADVTFHDDYEFTGIMLGLEDYGWDGGSGGTFLWQGGEIKPGETVSVFHLYSK